MISLFSFPSESILNQQEAVILKFSWKGSHESGERTLKVIELIWKNCPEQISVPLPGSSAQEQILPFTLTSGGEEKTFSAMKVNASALSQLQLLGGVFDKTSNRTEQRIDFQPPTLIPGKTYYLTVSSDEQLNIKAFLMVEKPFYGTPIYATKKSQEAALKDIKLSSDYKTLIFVQPPYVSLSTLQLEPTASYEGSSAAIDEERIALLNSQKLGRCDLFVLSRQNGSLLAKMETKAEQVLSLQGDYIACRLVEWASSGVALWSISQQKKLFAVKKNGYLKGAHICRDKLVCLFSPFNTDSEANLFSLKNGVQTASIRGQDAAVYQNTLLSLNNQAATLYSLDSLEIIQVFAAPMVSALTNYTLRENLLAILNNKKIFLFSLDKGACVQTIDLAPKNLYVSMCTSVGFKEIEFDQGGDLFAFGYSQDGMKVSCRIPVTAN